jgi:EmrB/QacA subfamily drug resistance transporter
MLMIVLDTTVVVVAMPSIAHDLGFSPAGLAWVLNAYLIAFGGLLLLSGRLGDLIGTKRVFLAGLALFTLSSLFCGVAWNGTVLVAARFIQGVGGAMASSVILAMIVTEFEETRERTRAMSIFNFVASAGGAIGVLLGGFVTQSLGWHWVFLINVPIGIATFVAAQRFVSGSPGIGRRGNLDVLGAIAITAAVMCGVYAVVQIPGIGLSAPPVLAGGALSVAIFAFFLWRQTHASQPLVPLGLFRSRNIAGSNTIDALIVTGLFGFFLLEALHLRLDRHFDPFATGVAFLPVDVTIGVLSLGWSERIVARFGARPVLVAGTVLAVIAMGWFTLVPITAPYFIAIFIPMLLLGLGIGVTFPPLMLFAMSGTTTENAGVASGVINTTSQVGGAFGIAILATVAAAWNVQAAYALATALCIVAVVIAVGVLEPLTDETKPSPEHAVEAA